MPVYTAAFIFMVLAAGACTFDYGESESASGTLPDMVMENVEYVRVRSSDPIARFEAERAERFDRQGIMKLENFTFEQYGDRGETVNAFGRAGNASVEIESGDIHMNNGVRIEVESEDIIIETIQIEWRDEQRMLLSGDGEDVNVIQTNGTSITGRGLRADARRRTWEFSDGVRGTYIQEDND